LETLCVDEELLVAAETGDTSEEDRVVVLEALCVDEELLVAAETGDTSEEDRVLELGVPLADADEVAVAALCVDEELAVADGVKVTDELDLVLALEALADTLTEEDVDTELVGSVDELVVWLGVLVDVCDELFDDVDELLDVEAFVDVELDDREDLVLLEETPHVPNALLQPAPQ
ncbi:hypothetical protein LTR28_000289, partial [Elasticomyces elasticus]